MNRLSLTAANWSLLGWIGAALLAGLLLAWLPTTTAAWLLLITLCLLLTLRRPLFGLGVTLLVAPIAALERVIGTGLPVDSGQLFLFFTLAVWLAQGLARRDIRLRFSPVVPPLLLFVIVAALSLPGAMSPSLGLRELLKWGEMVLLIWLVLDLAAVKPQTELNGTARRFSLVYLLASMLLIAALLQALVGIWQFGLRGHGPEHFEILGRFYRAYGTFEQPNPFGGYMALNAALILGILYGLLAHALRKPAVADVHWPSAVGRLWSFLLRPSSFVLLLTAVAVSLAVLLSWSRGAWLGFGAALVTLLFFAPRKRWQGGLLLGLALAGGLLAWQLNLIPGTVSGRLASFQDDFRLGDVRGVPIHDANYAVLERLAHWQAAVRMAEANPWLGVGFGNYEPAYPDYALMNWPYALGHAHNYYLNLLAEVGIIGFIAYLFLWTSIVWQTIRLLNRTPWPVRGIPLGLLAAWAALSVHHLVDKLYVNNIYIHLGVMLALLSLTAVDEDKGVS